MASDLRSDKLWAIESATASSQQTDNLVAGHLSLRYLPEQLTFGINLGKPEAHLLVMMQSYMTWQWSFPVTWRQGMTFHKYELGYASWNNSFHCERSNTINFGTYIYIYICARARAWCFFCFFFGKEKTWQGLL